MNRDWYIPKQRFLIKSQIVIETLVLMHHLTEHDTHTRKIGIRIIPDTCLSHSL